MLIDVGGYTRAFEENVRERFKNVSSVKVQSVKGGYKSPSAVDWPYSGVDFRGNFYVNGEQRLNFFIELEFNQTPGLRQRLEHALSGDKIEDSGMLNRPHREYFDSETGELHPHHISEEQSRVRGAPAGVTGSSFFREYVDSLAGKRAVKKGRDRYFISCRIKRVPKNPRDLVDNIFGNVIGPIFKAITSSN